MKIQAPALPQGSIPILYHHMDQARQSTISHAAHVSVPSFFVVRIDVLLVEFLLFSIFLLFQKSFFFFV